MGLVSLDMREQAHFQAGQKGRTCSTGRLVAAPPLFMYCSWGEMRARILLSTRREAKAYYQGVGWFGVGAGGLLCHILC